MSYIFCWKFPFIKKQTFVWNGFPVEVQQHIAEYLTPKDKANLSLTCKKNYDIVKSVPNKIHCLQFSPIRYNAQFAEVIVHYDEERRNSEGFYFDKQGHTSYLKVTKKIDGKESVVSSRALKSDYREMADACFQGWITGSTVHTLDIRGEYTGKLPTFLAGLVNISFNDKYKRTASAIPAWLDVIEMGAINFILMSDHWDQILSHRHFADPRTTCKLTGYDGIGHECLGSLNCRRIELNNIRDEKSFNVLVKKWAIGGYPNTFEQLVVTTATRPLITERLLEEIKVQSLNGSMFEESEIGAEYFLVFGGDGKYGLFCGINRYARFTVIDQQIVDEIPSLAIYFPRVWKPGQF